MARKNLLAGLISPKLPAGNSVAESLSDKTLDSDFTSRSGPLGTRGAIGAVTRSIENLKSSAAEAEEMRARLASGDVVVDLDPASVDPSPVTDRIPDTSADLGDFVEAIRISGQKVPILVRPHPTEPSRYQVAYGHRRLWAAVQLGRSVRAVVRGLTDPELVVAQGQENSARRDLSFIERALYAAKLEQAGFGRETIMAALNIDKTGLSRLISVAVKIPREIVAHIGPAPKIGRDRWTDLAAKLDNPNGLEAIREAISGDTFSALTTHERFEIVIAAVHASRRKAKATASASRAISNDDGKLIARVERAGKRARVVLDEPPFADFLAEHLPRLHAEWRAAGNSVAKVGGRKMQ